MIGVRQFVRMLESHLNKKFPELKVSLYVSKMKKHIHMGLDIALFSLTRHDQVIEEIKNFRMYSFDIEKHFKFVFPHHIGCTKWKYDNVIMRQRIVL